MSDDKTDRDGPPETSWASGLQPSDLQTPSRDGGEEGGFLRRWSRRKGAQSKTAEKSATAVSQSPQTGVAEPPAEDQLELPPEAPVRGRMITSPPGGAATANDAKNAGQEEAEDADLPDVEEMNAESDFTPFLKKGVSEQLQRKALRKLWLSDPVLANVDGLLDYGDDFTDAAMVIENMKTVYTVGRGMVPKPVEPEAEVEAEADESLEDETAAEGTTSKEGETEAGEDVLEGDEPEDAAPGETPAIAQSHDDAEPPAAQNLTNERPVGIESKTNTEKS